RPPQKAPLDQALAKSARHLKGRPVSPLDDPCPMEGAMTRRDLSGILLVFWAAACGGNQPAASPELQNRGEAQFNLDLVPQSVACLRVTIQGASTKQRLLDVQPGSSASMRLSGLPVGLVAISADA